MSSIVRKKKREKVAVTSCSLIPGAERKTESDRNIGRKGKDNKWGQTRVAIEDKKNKNNK